MRIATTSDIGHWSRNDTFSRSAVQILVGGQRRPPLRKRYRGCNGRATARVAPTEALQGVQWAGGQGRPPLRRECKIERRGEGTPPYGGVTRSACMRADRGVRPYGSVTGGAMGGRPQGSPLRSAARNVWAGYRPLRKFFDREGMVCFGFWWRRMTRAPGC